MVINKMIMKINRIIQKRLKKEVQHGIINNETVFIHPFKFIAIK